jgi:hypothetical protein
MIRVLELGATGYIGNFTLALRLTENGKAVYMD